jgi:hypothetical protein
VEWAPVRRLDPAAITKQVCEEVAEMVAFLAGPRGRSFTGRQ